MHHTRVAAFLLGAWLLGSVFQAFVATRNFRTVDAVLASPSAPASAMIQTLGRENARLLLRYLAGEENRGYFENWELGQLVIGTVLIGLLLAGGEKRLLAGMAGFMLVLTLFQHFKMTPDLIALGHSLDFVPASVEAETRQQFGRIHAIYGGIELAKMLLAATIAAFLFSKRRGRLRDGVDIDAVNYADHRHINR